MRLERRLCALLIDNKIKSSQSFPPMNFNIPTSYSAPQQQRSPAITPAPTDDAPLCFGHRLPCVQKASGADKKFPGRLFWACSQKPYCSGKESWVGYCDEPLSAAVISRKRAAPEPADDRAASRLDACEKAISDLVAYVRVLESELKNVQASVYHSHSE